MADTPNPNANSELDENAEHASPASPDSEQPAAPATRSDRGERPDSRDRLQRAAAGDGASLDPAEETELWQGRASWKAFAGSIILWVLGLAALGYVIYLIASSGSKEGGSGSSMAFKVWLVIAAISGVVVFGRVIFAILSCRYRLTTQRIFVAQGLFSQTIDHTELIRVDDVQIRKTFMNRLLGVGSVVVFSTDTSHKQLTIAGVEAPENVGEHIRARMRTMRRKSLFVENL